ncbi:MAG: hypothetical protein MJ134_10615 [Lachnospiraceae bacterium]|nr:hypothetical protein [Lachnospiraceae bacterium]
MNKLINSQLHLLLKTLEQTSPTIEENVCQNDLEKTFFLLEDCQNVAIQIGQSIEECCGEGTNTVHFLEEYCEYLYALHQALSSENTDSIDEVCNCLKQSLWNAKDCFLREISCRKAAVFLPYKASMWDSLEAVWQQYEKDPDWDAYIMPIPYFDKAPDGSLQTYHYEGDQYPKHLPIVSYQDIDLAELQPDCIYIHNPYDGGNYVTSVHPDFYASKLKEYTKKLVYIPYFVLAEPNPHNQASIEALSGFARTPGVFHAHEVIVQSENMRRCYIENLVQFLGEDTRFYWEQKIKGTGSPKLEKLKNTRKEDLEIPTSWQAKLYCADGSRKKVILYNTSIAAFLQDSEAMLQKMQDVFGFFQHITEAVVLLWRPHPLLESTIRSMRPALLSTYQKLFDWYKEQDFGILDDTPDLDRAIILADAYYGDSSSLVQLCQAVKMPIMIQNVHVLTEE